MARVILAAILLCAVASYVSAAPTVFNMQMSGAKEPNASGQLGVGDPTAFANGTLTLDPDANTISWNLNYGGFREGTTSFSGFHIHGQASPTQNVGIYRGFPTPTQSPTTPGVLSGSIDTVFDPDLSNKIDTILGAPHLYYLNLHTQPFYPGGAVRDQLPEPTTLTMLVCGAMGLMMRRRKI